MYTYECTVVRVVDGDTLVVSIDLGFHVRMQEYVRLADVDAPEIFGARAEPAGKDAKAFVEGWIAEHGPSFVLVSSRYDQREKYGRCLGHIFAGDRSGFGEEGLNEALRDWLDWLAGRDSGIPAGPEDAA